MDSSSLSSIASGDTQGSSDPLKGAPTQTASRGVSGATRSRALSRGEHQCWLCGENEGGVVDVCDNVSAATPGPKVIMWKEMGILAKNFYLSHLGNLICLCTNCHRLYDLDSPAWVLLPDDLGPLVEFEMEDYAAREEAATRGIRKRRSLPPKPHDGTTCRPYIISRTFRGLDWSRFPQTYKGWPQSLILKAIGACFTPTQRVNLAKSGTEAFYSGVPDEVLEAVQKLVSLWNRPDPEVRVVGKHEKRMRTEQEEGEGGDESDGGGQGKAHDEEKASKRPKLQHKQQRGNEEKGKGHSGRTSRGRAHHESPSTYEWEVGPDKSASDFISEIMEWRNRVVEANKEDE